MKHLITTLAVFLLIGCQTTNSTPNAVQEPALPKVEVKPELKEEKKVEKEVQPPSLDNFDISKYPPGTPVRSFKPVMCSHSEVIHKGLSQEAGEKPFMVWKDLNYGYLTVMFINAEKGTVTVLEYPPNSPGLACFSNIGIELKMRQQSEKTGTKIRFIP